MSYSPANPQGTPINPAYAQQRPSPYLAGNASRPQQYANQAYVPPGGGGAPGQAGAGPSAVAGGPGSRGPYQKKGPGPFAVPLKQMMFGFGDEPDAPEETVAVMEDLLGHFVQELCSLPPLPTTHPHNLSGTLKPRTITSSTLRSNLSPHPLSTPLLSRFQELLILQKDVSAAKKPFDVKADDLAKGSGAVLYDEEGKEVVMKKRKRGAGGTGGGMGGAEKKRIKKKREEEMAARMGTGAAGGEGGGAGGGGEGAGGEGGDVKPKKKIGRPKTVPGSNKGAGPSI